MLIELYAFFTIIGFVFFFVSLKQEPKVLFGSLSMVIFFMLAMASGNIETGFCELPGQVNVTITSMLPALLYIKNLKRRY